MPTLNRRDQAHAHRFLNRRLSAALIQNEPDSADMPMRKLGVATFSSVMVALLAMAGFGIYGLLRPGGATSWKNGQSLILEQETGTRYVFTGGKLHPVLNYASARLLLGQQALTIASVSAASLSGTPRGLPIGIPGAPDELPTPATLTTGPWSVCSLPSVDAAGNIQPYVRVTAGGAAAASGAGSAPPGAVSAGGRGVLVSGQDGTIYLVWNDHRLRVPGGEAALTGLGYSGARPLPVGDAWLSAVPQGPDLAAPPVTGAGASGPMAGGHSSRVGQVYVSGGSQYYVMLADGLAPVTQTQAYLLLAADWAARLYPATGPAAITVSAAVAASIRSQASVDARGLPARPPALVDTATGQLGVCDSYQPGGSGVPVIDTVTVASPAMPAAASTGAPGGGTGGGTGSGQVGPLGTALADQVRIPPGGGVVMLAVAVPGGTSGTLYLVTDQGVKYPLPDTSVLTALGLGGVTPARIPVAVAALLPTGPTLDQQAAAKTVSP